MGNDILSKFGAWKQKQGSSGASSGATSVTTPKSTVVSSFDEWKKKKKPQLDQVNESARQAQIQQEAPVSKPVDQVAHEESKSFLGHLDAVTTQSFYKGMENIGQGIKSIGSDIQKNPTDFGENKPNLFHIKDDNLLGAGIMGAKKFLGQGVEDFGKGMEDTMKSEGERLTDKSAIDPELQKGLIKEDGKFDWALAGNPKYAASQVASGIFSMIPGFAATLATGGTGGMLATMTLMEKGNAYEDYTQTIAKNKGIDVKDLSKEDLDQADNLSTIYGGLSGVLETLPLEGFLSKVGGKRAAASLLQKAVLEVPKDVLIQMTQEGTTEGLQQFAQNLIIKQAGLDPNRDLMGGVAESAYGGAVTGGAMGIVPAISSVREESGASAPVANPNIEMITQAQQGSGEAPAEAPQAPSAPQVGENVPAFIEALTTGDTATRDSLSPNLSSEELTQVMDTLDKAYNVADPETKQLIGKDFEYVTNLSAEREATVHEVAGEVVAKKTTENLDNNVENLSMAEVKEVNELLDKVKEKTQETYPVVTNNVVQTVERTTAEISDLQTQKKELLAKKAQIKEESPTKAKEIQTAINNVDENIHGLKEFVKQPKIRPEQQSKVPTAGYAEIKEVGGQQQIFYRGTDKVFSPKKFESKQEAQTYLKKAQEKTATLPKETPGGIPITYKESNPANSEKQTQNKETKKPTAIVTPRQAAKKLIESYVKRGDTIKQLKDGQMGESSGRMDASIGGFVNGKNIGSDKIQVNAINGKKLASPAIFSLKELHEEIKNGSKEVQDLFSQKEEQVKSEMALAENRTKVIRSTRSEIARGTDVFIAKMEREAERGAMTPQELGEIKTFIEIVKDQIDDVALRIYDNGGGQGIYEYTQSVMELFRENIGKKTIGFKRTTIHELWHALSRFLPKEDFAMMNAQFKNEQKAFFEANPEFQTASELTDEDAKRKIFGKSLDTYKFYSFDEWFAETMAEKTMREIAGKYGSKSIITKIFDHIGSMLRAMYNAVAKQSDQMHADKVFDDFMTGKNKEINFKHGLDEVLRVNKRLQKDTYYSENGQPYIQSHLKAGEWDLQRDLVVKKVDELLDRPDKFTNTNNTMNFDHFAILKGIQEDMHAGKDTKQDVVDAIRLLELYKSPVYLTTGVATELMEGRGAFKVSSKMDLQDEEIDAQKYVDNVKELTTPILEQLKGKEVISKQFIADLAKKQETKQVERDLITKVLAEFGDKVDVKRFVEKLNSRLLPLKVIESDTYANYGMDNIGMDYDSGENPPKTHIYDSPFKHGKTGHFSNDFRDEVNGSVVDKDSGLFGHTRVADDQENRYILEIQSDVFQGDKAGAILPSEIKKQIAELEKSLAEDVSNSEYGKSDSLGAVVKNKKGHIAELQARLDEMQSNDQLMMFDNYKNTWHERMIREEIARAAEDGKTNLRFPTPHTLSKIEGYIGENAPYELDNRDNEAVLGEEMTYGGEIYVITRVYGDGSFNAVERDAVTKFYGNQTTIESKDLAEEEATQLADEAQSEWDGLDEKEQKLFESFKASDQAIEDLGDYNLQKIVELMYSQKMDFDKAREAWEAKYVDEFDAVATLEDQGFTAYQEYTGGKVIAWDSSSNEETFDAPDSYSKSEGDADFNYETDLSQQEQKTVARFYDKQVRKYLEKIRKGNLEQVEDPNGNTWLETKITEADAKPVMAFLPDLEKPETSTEKFSKIVNKRNELMKQKKTMENDFAESDQGKALQAKNELQTQRSFDANKGVQQGIKNNPRFIKEGTVSDAMGSGWLMSKAGRQVVVEANKVATYIERGYTKDIEVDSLASEAGFENGQDYLNDQLSKSAPVKFETAVKRSLAYTNKMYQDITAQISSAEAELKVAKEDKNSFYLGMKVGGSIMRTKFKEKMSIWKHRKEKVKAAKDFFALSDSAFNRIGGNRNVQYLSEEEFQGFMTHLERQAEKEVLHSNAKALVVSQIKDKQLRKVDNLRRALKLPTIENMTTEQLQQYDEAMTFAQPEDEFLTQRMIETLHLTELKGAQTVREVREVLNKKLGENFAAKGITISPLVDRMRWDTPLAESNEFMHLLVQEKDMAFLTADARTLIAEEKIDELVKKARKSEPRTLADKLIPEDTKVFDYLGSNDKATLARDMTPAQLEVANWLQGQFEEMRDYLIQNQQLKAYRENYITHIRKDFLETWKNDGLWSSIKTVFEQQKIDEAGFEILSGETEEIIPFEKWFQFAMKRSGVIDPSKNVMRAFMAYKHTFERKVALDSLIPKIMTYVYSLTPTQMTEKGLVMDRSLKKFVTSWLNSKKGRKFDFGGVLKQGSKADSVIMFLRAFTSLIDIGASIPIGIASNAGEQTANFITLGAKQYTKGAIRARTKQGQAIIAKYENYIGKSPWKTLAQGSAHIGNKLMSAMFYLFHSSQVRANKMFLLGAMSDAEYKAGTIETERLAQMKIDMGRWRVVEGNKSILGNTSIGGIATQYKTWAIVMLRTSASNIAQLSKTRDFKSRAGQETIRQVIVATTVGLITLLAFADDKDKSFLATIYKKVIQDALSSLQALDPTTYVSVPRVGQFLIDLTSSIKQIVTLEEYKASGNGYTKGDLKGLNKLKKTLEPAVGKQIESAVTPAPKPKN